MLEIVKILVTSGNHRGLLAEIKVNVILFLVERVIQNDCEYGASDIG